MPQPIYQIFNVAYVNQETDTPLLVIEMMNGTSYPNMGHVQKTFGKHGR